MRKYLKGLLTQSVMIVVLRVIAVHIRAQGTLATNVLFPPSDIRLLADLRA